MREIKYRQPIWTKGEFAYWHYWGFISDGHFASPETNSNPIQKAHEESQQFTGLYDKNGKEIYEGDILKSESDIIRVMDNRPTGKTSIKYFTIEYQTEYSRFQRKALGSDKFEPLPSSALIFSSWIEVIGNIYENPDLLT